MHVGGHRMYGVINFIWVDVSLAIPFIHLAQQAVFLLVVEGYSYAPRTDIETLERLYGHIRIQ